MIPSVQRGFVAAIKKPPAAVRRAGGPDSQRNLILRGIAWETCLKLWAFQIRFVSTGPTTPSKSWLSSFEPPSERLFLSRTRDTQSCQEPLLTGSFASQCGLIVQGNVDGHDEVEIGYSFLRDQWNSRFATEAAIACRDFGFNLNLSRLVNIHLGRNQQHKPNPEIR